MSFRLILASAALGLCLLNQNATAALAETHFDFAHLEFESDSGVQLGELPSFMHHIFIEANGARSEVDSDQPWQRLLRNLNVGAVSATADGDADLGTTHVHGHGGSAVAYDGYQGRFEVSGEGYFRVDLPYTLTASAGLNERARALVSLVIEAVDDSVPEFYEYYEITDQGGAVDSNLGDGSFDVALYNGGGTRSYEFTLYGFSELASPVPEPQTYALIGVGLLAVLAARRAQHRSGR